MRLVVFGMGFLVLLLIVFPFYSVAQDVARASAPVFSVVAPLDQEVVSGPVGFLVGLEDPSSVVRAHIRSTDSGVNFEASFSSDEGWLTRWDSTSVENGLHSFSIEVCSSISCSEKMVSVVVRNDSTPSPITPPSRDRPDDVDVSPGDGRPTLPSDDSPNLVWFSPSNVPGAFQLMDSSDEIVARSAGGQMHVPAGRYSAHFSFWDQSLASVDFSPFLLSSDSSGVFLSSLSLPSILHAKGKLVHPTSSLRLVFGVDSSRRVTLAAPLREGEVLLWCSGSSTPASPCSSPQFIEYQAGGSFSLDNVSEGVLVWGTLLGDDRPVDGEPVTVALSNHVGSHSLTDKDGFRVPGDSSALVVVPGDYSLLSLLSSSPLSSISLKQVSISQSGLLTEVTDYPVSLDGSQIVSVQVHASFSDGFFTVGPGYDMDLLQVCDQWDSSSSRCLGDWSPSRNFSLSSFSFALRFYPLAPPVVSDPSVPLTDQLALEKALADLNVLFQNRAFFSKSFTADDSFVLYSLFSKMEVSLECGSQRRVVETTLPAPSSGEVSVSTVSTQSVLPLEGGGLTEVTDVPPVVLPVPDDVVELNRGDGEQPWDYLSCDSVSLQQALNEVDPNPNRESVSVLGDSSPFIKQSFVLSNASDVSTRRLVNVRLWARPFSLSSDERSSFDSPRYQVVRTHEEEVPLALESDASVVDAPDLVNESLVFRSREGNEVGRYDWTDYWRSGLFPTGLVHMRDDIPVIDTVFSVDVPARESVVIDPIYELSSPPNYDVVWDGNSGDVIGNTLDSNSGIQVVNVDNNGFANDLLITAPMADVNGKMNNGAVYLIKDVNLDSGTLGLANQNNFSVRWNGGVANDYLGRTGRTNVGSGIGVQLLDTDGNGYANDLLLTAVHADVNAKADIGAVYLIKDVDKLIGIFDLNNPNNYSASWIGSTASLFLGDSNLGGQGVQVANLDGNVAANDLIINASQADFSRTDAGSIYVIMDINRVSGMKDLNNLNNFFVRFDGNNGNTTDWLGGCYSSGNCTQVVNSDKNAFANDLLITTSAFDCSTTNTNCGSVMLLKDIPNVTAGIRALTSIPTFGAQWTGGALSANIGNTNGYGSGTQLFDFNGDGFVNDLLLTAPLVDLNNRIDNGAVFLISDINTYTGATDLNNPNALFTAAWTGASSSDRIGSASISIVSNRYVKPYVRVFAGDANKTANEMIIAASLADINSFSNSGAIYYIEDLNAVRGRADLSTQSSSYLLLGGSAANEEITLTRNDGYGFELMNVDNNTFTNDLLIGAGNADINGKTDTGVWYLVRDIRRFRTSTNRGWLGNSLYYSMRINGGAGDRLSDNNYSGPPFLLMDVDNNAADDDLLLASPYTDVNGKTENGAIYLMRNIGDGSGSFDLNSVQRRYGIRWSGVSAYDMIGDTNRSGSGLIPLNLDNDANVDDFLVGVPRFDSNKTDVGAVYLIRNIGLTDGNRNFDLNTNFTHRWQGDNNGDIIGDNNAGGFSFNVYNMDGNTTANDLVILSSAKDMNNLVNNGAVYLFKDITTSKQPNGILAFAWDNPLYDANSYQLSMNINLSARVTCRIANCGSVDTNIQYCYGVGCLDFYDLNTDSTTPLYIVSGTNPDNNADLKENEFYDVNWTVKANDTNVFSLRLYSVGTTSGPSIPPSTQIHIVIDPDNSYDLLQGYNFQTRFEGGTTGDYLSATNFSDAGAYFVNIDNGAYNNDLILSAPRADVNGKTDNGAIYLFKNFDSNTGTIDLNLLSNSYSARWYGGANSDFLGDTNMNGPGFQIVNIDNNAYSNDLIMVAPNADVNGKTNNGAVYLFRDIDKLSGSFDLLNNNTGTNRWTGGMTGDQLGNGNRTYHSVQIANLDGEATANDILIAGAYVDVNSKPDAGRVFMLMDVNTFSGARDFNIPSNFTAAWNGTVIGDQLGSSNSTTSTQQDDGMFILDVDGNGIANDLLINAVNADVNSKADVGAVYLIKDIATKSGVIDLNHLTNSFAVTWNGGRTTDRIGFNNASGESLWVTNLDDQLTANDLFIVGSLVDGDSTDNGAIYLIKDINTLSGARDLNNLNNSSAYWEGGVASDSLGDTSQSGESMFVVNLDGNTSANDLILNSPLTDTNGKTNIGAIYMIKDVVNKTGRFDLNVAGTFNAVWQGNTASDFVGDFESTGTVAMPLDSGNAVQIVNIDNNAYSNDLIIAAPQMDINAKADAGAIFIIKDINRLSGAFNLVASYSSSYTFIGAAASDLLGDTNRSGIGVQLVNVDNNAFANDLLLTAPRADVNSKTNNGAVYLIKDISADNNGSYDLSVTSKYDICYNGASGSDFLGDSGAGGLGVQLVNVDNQAYSNDLLITAAYSNTGIKTLNGTVYLDKNIDVDSGQKDFVMATNYDKRWRGGRNGNQLGGTLFSRSGVQLVNADNESFANDLLLSSPSADINFVNKTNNGGVYYVPDIATTSSLDYSFVLFIPTSGCTSNKGNITGGVSCQRAYFETTDTTGTSDENQVVPEGQTASQPFFMYDNQSTTSTDFNFVLDLNEALPSYLVLKASNITGGYEAACGGNPATGCVLIPTAPTTQSVGRATYTTGAQDLNVFFWVDFVAATVGDVDRNVDSNVTA